MRHATFAKTSTWNGGYGAQYTITKLLLDGHPPGPSTSTCRRHHRSSS